MGVRAVSTQALLGLAPIVVLLAVWHAVTAWHYAPAALLPLPEDVFRRFFTQIVTPEFLSQLSATLFRLFVGFVIAATIGVPTGLAAATHAGVGAVVRPIVRILAPVPKIALYPALILLLGFDHASKVTLVAADALFPILLATFYGASAVEEKLLWSARAAGTPPRQLLVKIILPAALPSILTGFRIGLVISCIVVFLAEMIASTDGLGYLLIRAARSFHTIDMFVPLIAISVLGLALDGLLYATRQYLLRGYAEG